MVKLDMFVRFDMVMGKLYFTHIWLKQIPIPDIEPNFKVLSYTYNNNTTNLADFDSYTWRQSYT